MALNYNAAVTISAQFTGQQAVSQAQSSFKSLDATVKGSVGGFQQVTTALKTLAGAFIVREAVLFGKSILDIGDQLSTLHQKTGLGVDALSSLKTAGELANVEFGQLESGLSKFAVTASNAGAGVLRARSGFDALRISVKDANGSILPTEELLRKVADRFSQMKDGPDKAAIAVRLFGKAGADLIPVLNQGSEQLDKYGLKFGKDFADNANAFNDSMNLLGVALKQILVDGLGPMLPTLTQVSLAIVDFTKSMAGANDSTGATIEVIKELVSGIATVGTGFSVGMSMITRSFQGLGDDIAYIAANIIDRLSTIGDEVKTAATQGFTAALKLEDDYNARRAERDTQHQSEAQKRADDFEKSTIQRATRLHALQDAIYSKSAKPVKTATTGSSFTPDTSALNNSGQKTKYEKELDAIQKFKDAQQQSIDVQKLETDRVNMSEVEFKKLTEARKIDGEVAKASVGFTKEGVDAYREAGEAIKAQKDALADLEEQQKHSFGDGAKKAFKDYLEAAKDVSSQTKAMFGNLFQGMEDAIVKFVQTGKLSFADLANQIEADLIRIAIRQAVVFGVSSLAGAFAGPAGSLAGGDTGATFAGYAANGGIMTSKGMATLNKYANGGIANSPQLAVFGEGRTPEAYVPLPDGRSIPVTMKGSGDGSGVNVQINVTVASDGSSSSDAGSSAGKGQDLGRLISASVTQEIIKAKRPGGLLSKA